MEKQKLLWHYLCQFCQYVEYIEEYYVLLFEKYQVRKRISSKGWDFIHSSVHEAQHVYCIPDLTVNDLEYVIWNGMRNPWKPWKKFHFSRYRHNNSSHYVRLQHHSKKELSEKQIAKQNWEKLKGFKKDKQKHGWGKRNAGRYYKKLSNKIHRQWQKEQIFNEKFDSMNDVDYKYFLDPWMWD